MELRQETQLQCGLENIQSEAQCQNWTFGNQEFYSRNATFQRLQNCQNYFQAFKTISAGKPVTQEELQTPLAFSIIAHNQISLLETLIASIFRPHNAYCIFVDAKASPEFQDMVSNLVDCYKSQFPQSNIFKAGNSHPIYWAHISMLEADIRCLDLLLESDRRRLHQWQYFINQPGTSLPTQKVDEIARKLSRLKGHCDAVLNTEEPQNASEQRKLCPVDSIYSIRNVTLDGRFQYQFKLRY